MLKIHISLLIILLLVLGCSSKESEQSSSPIDDSEVSIQENNVIKSEPFIETGDLKELSQRGMVRVLAPRFDTEQELPRVGVAVQEYQKLAEQFVVSLGLEPEWIFVDSYEALLADLNAGKGDLIVTNLSVTENRENEVAFSVALATIDEVLITRKDTSVDSLDALEQMSIAIPEGTAYQETLVTLKEKYPGLVIELHDGSTSSSQMLQEVENAEVTATVIDSDIADLLLAQYPQLVKGPLLKKHRKVAWATRKDSLQLRRSLNEFLVSEHIQSGHHQNVHHDWEQIKSAKKIRMLTLNNPASYFMWRGELMGFDYDLMKEFAKRNQLRLEVVVKDDINGLLTALQKGGGDVIASSLTVTAERKQRGLIFSRRYMNIREQLVGLSDAKQIDTLEQLAGKRVAVNPQTAFFKRLENLKKNGIDFQIIQKPGVPTETLIAGLAQGEYDFTVADSHLAAIEQSYLDNLHINLDLTQDVDIAWGLRADQPELLNKLNEFINKEYRGLFYNVTFNKYFVNSKNIRRHKKYRVIADGMLSPYDEIVKRHTKNYTLDWRLIIAQIYQESKFNPNAKSFAGAQGLMQVMPRTARQFGYKNLFEPDNAVAAGLAYLHWLHDRFPGYLSLDERLYFVLASYNAGAGHVRDARVLAKQLGNDPDRWFGSVENAMLLLSQPNYANKARFGYVRGSEPVNYVRNIRDRYLGYLRVAEIDDSQLSKVEEK